eukprot:gene9658-1865_t
MLSGTHEVFEKIKSQANDHFKQKNYQRAINYYEHAMKLPVSSAQKSICLGNISSCFYQMKDYNSSLKYALESLDKDPLNEKSILKKAYSFERLGEFEDSIKAYLSVIKEPNDSFQRMELLLDKLKQKNYFSFLVFNQENEIEFEVKIPKFLVEKFLPSVGNKTFKTMSKEDKYEYLFILLLISQRINQTELEYPITKTTIKILFRSLFDDRVAAENEELVPLICLSDYFVCSDVRNEAILQLLDYIDEKNCLFFYKLSKNHILKERTRWNDLYDHCCSTLKSILISVDEGRITKEEIEYFDEIPEEILKNWKL